MKIFLTSKKGAAGWLRESTLAKLCNKSIQQPRPFGQLISQAKLKLLTCYVHIVCQ